MPGSALTCGSVIGGSGKTTLALYCLITDALANRRLRPRYAYVAPLYRQAKLIAWDLLKHLTQPLPGTRINEAELRVDLPGTARIQLFGADNPDALRGPYWDGVVFDEYAEMRPRVWTEVVRPALADRQGWALFLSTPKGHNHFYDLYRDAQHLPGWHTALYRADETGIIPPDELDAARAVMAPEQFNQEFLASFESALIGAYYASYLQSAQDEGRITTVPWQPQVPVHVAFDIGIGDSTAIWFIQVVGDLFHCIEYFEAQGQGVEYYVKLLRDRPYTLGRIYWPHDVDNRDWSGSGLTRLQVVESLGLTNNVVVPRGEVADGIQAVRTLFPRFRFDAQKCREGIDALKSYRREWSETRKTWLDSPMHDWSSHAADAMRYWCVGWTPEKPTPLLMLNDGPQGPPWARESYWRQRR
jgi:phage terminase large subunit